MDRKLPKISVISAVYNKAHSLDDYIFALTEQTYKGDIEVILVDDKSTDNSAMIIKNLQKKYNKNNFQIKFIQNEKNIGNCASRNRGIQKAEGEILVVIDADCIVNEFFLEEHVIGHQKNFDVCIGPMGIESRGRDIFKMRKELIKNDALINKEMRLQYPRKKTCFLNCVTRNFSITKAFLKKMNEPLFDEIFTYKNDTESGFGWEDVEMGFRIFKKGGKIYFTPRAISIHKSHAPSIPDSIKPLLSLKNFARLLRKHREIAVIAPDWTAETFQKIYNWLKMYNYADNHDTKFISSLIKGNFKK
ncbi:glycosyltransferase family 2 protein [Bacillus methanolicus]|uniref:glycosyltransferase family 2 protein n=1 Tax=Bacillus methanolicus TaxID=1471 RepID=UPI002380BB22|nr:glycosyltransferase [Bacillus methanolicus]